jgi:hypothetical protein
MITRFRLIAAALVVGLVAGLGCERSPEDVEKWRNAKRGMEKMQEWAASPDEPMAVRIRALEVIIEEHSPTTLEPTLEDVEDGEARQKLVSAATERVQKMWNAQDIPTIDEETDQKGGKIEVDQDAKTIKAKDAAYYLVPVAKGKDKETLQGILDEWLSTDWELRDQLGKTDLSQLLSRASQDGAKHLFEWLKETDDPAKVASMLRDNTDGLEDQMAKILRKRAEENHPELSTSLLSAIVNSESDEIVPYLKKATRDSKSSPKLIDQAMEAIKNIQGPRAVNFFTELISEEKGKLRWAAVNDLIAIRGKGGILSAATALPLEKDTYAYPDEDSFKKDSEWFANFVAGEMKDADVTTISSTLVRALESERWPVQVLGLTTARAAHQKNLLGDGADKVRKAVNNLTSSRTEVPGWGEAKRVGEIAHNTADVLEK